MLQFSVGVVYPRREHVEPRVSQRILTCVIVATHCERIVKNWWHAGRPCCPQLRGSVSSSAVQHFVPGLHQVRQQGQPCTRHDRNMQLGTKRIFHSTGPHCIWESGLPPCRKFIQSPSGQLRMMAARAVSPEFLPVLRKGICRSLLRTLPVQGISHRSFTTYFEEGNAREVSFCSCDDR